MKKIMIGIGVFIGVVVVGIVLYIGILAIITRCAPYTVTKAEISIHADGVQRANMHQDEAYVKMMAVNDKLYFYIESWWEKHGLRRKFNRKLCEIGNGEIQSVADFGVVYGYDQRYIYAHIDNELVEISNIKSKPNDIRFDSSGGAFIDFMNGQLMISKDPKTGEIKIETYEYKFHESQKWSRDADYIPQKPSW